MADINRLAKIILDVEVAGLGKVDTLSKSLNTLVSSASKLESVLGAAPTAKGLGGLEQNIQGITPGMVGMGAAAVNAFSAIDSAIVNEAQQMTMLKQSFDALIGTEFEKTTVGQMQNVGKSTTPISAQINQITLALDRLRTAGNQMTNIASGFGELGKQMREDKFKAFDRQLHPKNIETIKSGLGGLAAQANQIDELSKSTKLLGKEMKSQISVIDDVASQEKAAESARMQSLRKRTQVISSLHKQQLKQVETEKKAAQQAIQSRTMFSMNFLSMLFVGQMVQRFFTNFAFTTVSTFMKIADATNKQKQSIVLLGAAWEFLKFTIGNAIATALEPFIPRIVEIIELTANWIDQNDDLFSGIVAAGIGLGFLMSLVGNSVLLWASLANIFGTLIPGLKEVVNTLGFSKAVLTGLTKVFDFFKMLGLITFTVSAVWNLGQFIGEGGIDNLKDAIIAGLGAVGIALENWGKSPGARTTGTLLFGLSLLFSTENKILDPTKKLSVLDIMLAAWGTSMAARAIAELLGVSSWPIAATIAATLIISWLIKNDIPGGTRLGVMNELKKQHDKKMEITILDATLQPSNASLDLTNTTIDTNNITTNLTNLTSPTIGNNLTTNLTVPFQNLNSTLNDTETKINDLLTLFGEQTTLETLPNSNFNIDQTQVSSIVKQAQDAGKKIPEQMAYGISIAEASGIKNALLTHMVEAAKLMPSSDAKEGPFSKLSSSGMSVMSTFAEGVIANGTVLKDAINVTFTDVLTNGLITPLTTANETVIKLTESNILLANAIAGEEASVFVAMNKLIMAEEEFNLQLSEAIPLSKSHTEQMIIEKKAATDLAVESERAASALERLNRARARATEQKKADMEIKKAIRDSATETTIK